MVSTIVTVDLVDFSAILNGVVRVVGAYESSDSRSLGAMVMRLSIVMYAKPWEVFFNIAARYTPCLDIHANSSPRATVLE